MFGIYNSIYERVVGYFSNTFRVKKLSENAVIPTRQTAYSAGYDLSASLATVIPSGDVRLVSTGISMAIPVGYFGKIYSRSSVVKNNGVTVEAGVIDADYRGEVKVMMYNLSQNDFIINEGDRIAQIVIMPIYTNNIVEVEELDYTIRGTGGFGSTGK